MKSFIIAVAAICFLWRVQGESCTGTNATSCVTTACVDGAPPVCIAGICTCTQLCTETEDLGRCRVQQDCRNRFNAGQLDCSCPTVDLHCVDGVCHCVHLSFH